MKKVNMVMKFKWSSFFLNAPPSTAKRYFDSATKVDIVSWDKWSWLNFRPAHPKK